MLPGGTEPVIEVYQNQTNPSSFGWMRIVGTYADDEKEVFAEVPVHVSRKSRHKTYRSMNPEER